MNLVACGALLINMRIISSTISLLTNIVSMHITFSLTTLFISWSLLRSFPDWNQVKRLFAAVPHVPNYSWMIRKMLLGAKQSTLLLKLACLQPEALFARVPGWRIVPMKLVTKYSSMPGNACLNGLRMAARIFTWGSAYDHTP